MQLQWGLNFQPAPRLWSSSIVFNEPSRVQLQVFPPPPPWGRSAWRAGRSQLSAVWRLSALIRSWFGHRSRSMSSLRVLQRLQTTGSAPPAASSGSWSWIVSSCCRLRTGPGSEPRRGLSVSGRGTMNVFNREMKKRQKNWAACLQDGHQYDYLRDEVRAETICMYKYTCWYFTWVFHLLIHHISGGNIVLYYTPFI